MDNKKLNDENTRLFKEYEQTKSIKTRNQIALLNYNLIYHEINKLYFYNQADYEDLEQESFFILLKAIDKYDYKKGFTFSTFAISYMKKTRRIIEKNKRFRNEISLNSTIKGNDEEETEIIETLSDEKADTFKAVESLEIINHLDKVLTYEEMEIIKLLYQEKLSIRKISIIFGVSKNKIWRTKNKCIKLIKKSNYFKDYY